MAKQQGNWYYVLSELWNKFVHRSFLRQVISVYDLSLNPRQVRFLNVHQEFGECSLFDHVMDMEVIQYLEKSL